MSTGRWYERKSLVAIEEDEFNEFKGHRNFAVEELPPWCFHPRSTKRSRKAASRAINAFLNSGRGGTVYLGIIDEGVVKGLYLTEFQKDHILLALKDLFSRYIPKVEDDKFQVAFVPIFGKDEVKDFSCLQNKLDKMSIGNHLKPHLLRTHDFCWCDKDLAERLDKDEQQRDYVIEVRILSQKPSFKMAQNGEYRCQLPAVHLNEEGRCYFRKSASCVEYSLEDVMELTKEQVGQLYEPILQSLRTELSNLTDSADED